VNDVLRFRKRFAPKGRDAFARALKQSNVPRDLIGNTKRYLDESFAALPSPKRWKVY